MLSLHSMIHLEENACNRIIEIIGDCGELEASRIDWGKVTVIKFYDLK